ncbi:MAG: SAM-dependent methyltransferase, partial [Gammaproteobacteria bacterium]|nr:SAM-dependent methyltransferase [Gammaproteobacteria bacterium]
MMHVPDEKKPALPAPGPEATAHSERLQALIKAEIQAQAGSIPFARFMELALYAPGLGYYSGGLHKFGREGDFTTAPEISALFSQSLAVQCAQVLESLGHADVLEAGAGSGIMAAGILAELERLGQLPDRYYILELSGELRQRQQQTLQDKVPHLLEKVQWLDALPVSGFRGVIIGNELLDAMPVQIFRIEDGEVRELHVEAEGEGFAYKAKPAAEDLIKAVRQIETQLGEPFAEGYESEINLAAQGWLHSISEIMEQGLLLFIDYGFPRHEFYHPQRSGGTLMCHYRHQAHPDPMVLVGLQDITAHVDFTAMAETAQACGLDVMGFT